tara:strand:- start:732 stop:1148 length:417 start_codon:yes stop_codon:yes gene_type:complete
MSKKKVGWQKYEDVLENQLSSPFIQTILEQINPQPDLEELRGELGEEEIEYLQSLETTTQPIVSISEELINDLSMITNFDCWVGHTNFDITPSVMRSLDKVRGVEILKICSRYRFFVGIGKMFDFKSVRKSIEEKILK